MKKNLHPLGLRLDQILSHISPHRPWLPSNHFDIGIFHFMKQTLTHRLTLTCLLINYLENTLITFLFFLGGGGGIR